MYVLAALAGEPMKYRPWECRQVTLRWFFSVIQWPRDDKGQLDFDGDSGEDLPPETYEDQFRRTWLMRCLPEWAVERKWRQFLKTHASPHQ